MFDFADQVVVVTGAAGNLGEAVALAFHEAGAKLALVDLKRENIEATFSTKMSLGEDNLAVMANLMDEESVAEMAETILEHFGRVDALINIAGGFTMGASVAETSLKTWEFMLNLNARTAFLTSRALLPRMLQQNSGKVVNIGARAALSGKANMASYVISKSAVIRLTESMAAEYKEEGLNVNCILPGTIDTPRNREESPGEDFSKWVAP
jgi:NAD(P)-dependent dehydrogenase (short-subunit alcohol dehydrogenase family)